MVKKCKLCGCNHDHTVFNYSNMPPINICGSIVSDLWLPKKQERIIPAWIVDHGKAYPNCVSQMIKDGNWNCCGHITEVKVTEHTMWLPYEPDNISFGYPIGYLTRKSGTGYVWTS